MRPAPIDGGPLRARLPDIDEVAPAPAPPAPESPGAIRLQGPVRPEGRAPAALPLVPPPPAPARAGLALGEVARRLGQGLRASDPATPPALAPSLMRVERMMRTVDHLLSLGRHVDAVRRSGGRV